MTEMTIEAAIIELNRLKSQERMDIDRERMIAAIDVLKDAAQYRIKRKPISYARHYYFRCTKCNRLFLWKKRTRYCSWCGQALDCTTY